MSEFGIQVQACIGNLCFGRALHARFALSRVPGAGGAISCARILGSQTCIGNLVIACQYCHLLERYCVTS